METPIRMPGEEEAKEASKLTSWLGVAIFCLRHPNAERIMLWFSFLAVVACQFHIDVPAKLNAFLGGKNSYAESHDEHEH